jgi:hypothetical protein
VLALLAVSVAASLLAGAPPPDDRQPVVLRAALDEGAQAWPVVDELVDGEVLRVRVPDGEPGATGTVSQCSTSCWNRYPVTFDADGLAQFQYQIERRECDPSSSCLMRVEIGLRVAVAFTVFGGPAPAPPTVTVTPAGPVAPGGEVSVHVDGLAPGSRAQVSFCAEECLGRQVGAADRSGRVVIDIRVGGRCEDCGIAVVAGSSRTVLPVRFVPPPSPDYDLARLVAGLALAAVLVAAAWRLVVVTDWRPPSEAAVPELEE